MAERVSNFILVSYRVMRWQMEAAPVDINIDQVYCPHRRQERWRILWFLTLYKRSSAEAKKVKYYYPYSGFQCNEQGKHYILSEDANWRNETLVVMNRKSLQRLISLWSNSTFGNNHTWINRINVLLIGTFEIKIKRTSSKNNKHTKRLKFKNIRHKVRSALKDKMINTLNINEKDLWKTYLKNYSMLQERIRDNK